MISESVETSQGNTTARLIARALLEYLPQVRFGLIANALPPFATSVLYQVLYPHLGQVRLALLGFNEIELDSPYVTKDVETVIAWRNTPDLNERLIVILNPSSPQEKTHSLEMLDPFTDDDLYRAICRIALQESPAHSLSHQLWQELNKRSFPLVARQLADLGHALQTVDVPKALPAIGLLPDPAMTTGDLASRIKLNREQVTWILSLESKDDRLLARTLIGQDGNDHHRTFRQIKRYAQNPIQENLAALTLDAVVRIRAAEKAPEPLSAEPRNRQTGKASTQKKQSPAFLADQLLKLNPFDADYQEVLDNLNHQAERITNWFYEADPEEGGKSGKKSVREVDFEDDDSEREDSHEILIDFQTKAEIGKVERPTKKEELHPLDEFVSVWVTPQNWGGRIQVDNVTDSMGDVADLLTDEATSFIFEPFLPLNKQKEHSLVNLFAALDQLQDVRDSNSLVTLFQILHTHRQIITHYRKAFLYFPDQAIQAPSLRAAIHNYLEAYDGLARQLQQVCRQVSALSPDATERAMAQFLALDVMVVELWYADKPLVINALLTPLHPLHLWKWMHMNTLMHDNAEPLDEKSLAVIKKAAQQLPTLLNTFLLHEYMFSPPRRLSENRLVLAGEIDNPEASNSVGIPYYKPVAQQSLTADGLRPFIKLFDRFLTLYPPAQLGLTLVLIDPPELSPILQGLTKMHQENRLYSARVYVYRTNERPAHDRWYSKDDESLQLFRDNPRWTLQVSLQKGRLSDIHQDMRSKQLYPHIVLLCDPSEAIVQETFRYVQEEATPFGVPVQLSYDSISDAIKLIPAPGGGMFDTYASLRNTLSGELQRKVLGVGNKGINPEDIRLLLNQKEGACWLAIIDWPHGTMEMPAGIGRRLAWQRDHARTLAVHTNERDWQNYWYEQLLFAIREMGLPPESEPKDILERLLELFPVLPEGLIALIRSAHSNNYHQAFDQEALRKLLGVLTVLNWYRQERDGLTLIQLDDEFQDWYDAADQTADYAAFWLDSDGLHVDVLTIHALLDGYNTLPPLAQARRPLTTLSQFATTLQRVFSDETIMTPIRRALLRERLTTAVFAPSTSKPDAVMSQSRTGKTAWAKAINGLFSGDYTPHVRLLDIRVALQEKSQQVDVQPFRDEADNYQRLIIRLPGRYLEPIESVDIGISAVPEVATDTSTQQSQEKELPAEYLVEVPTIMPETAVLVSEQVQRQAEELRRVLISYGIAIAGIDTEKSQIGSRFIRYWVRLQPPAGRLSEIQKYAEDIARELGSKTLPLIENIPGERYVGIDLAREIPETTFMAKGLAELSVDQPDKLLIAMGENVAGEAVQLDLTRLPHMLVAGQTGSGKTVFLSALITSLVWRHSAEQLQLVLVDPKQMDFGVFSQLPHLYNGRILYEPAEAVAVLRSLLEHEKAIRTKVFHEARCPNILEYNRRHPEQQLPWLVVVIDEFADIMLSLDTKERSAFEKQINRLAATGRAVGIHLVIATQRPTTDVITGTIKANIPARVSFRLPSQIDSRTVLDRTGAENLLGQGDMLVSLNNEVQRLQGYYASFEQFLNLLDNLGG
ncbi:MAG: hypothetical protein IAE79_27190 [Anaerolinea sp.]|nr:hypothetical protein [Anaerolinea sp.]